MENKERKWANVSLVIMFIGILAAVLPFAINADMFKWGYAVAVLGFADSIICFFVFLTFKGRAKVMDGMFSGENVLAHWNYSKDFWQNECTKDFEDSGIGKIAGAVLGGIFLIIGVVVFLADTGENGVFLLAMIGIGILFVIIGYISATAEKRRIYASKPEAIIAKDGVYYKNVLYNWNTKVVTYLESVSLNPDEPSTLLFVIRQLRGGKGSVGRYHKIPVSIPIPLGQEESADSIIKFFNLPQK